MIIEHIPNYHEHKQRIILKFSMSRSLILLIAILSGAGCIPHVSYDYDLQEEASLLSRVLGNEPETSIDILALSPEIRNLLDTNINPRWGTRHRLKNLRELLYDENQLNIHYDATNTLTATDTFNARAGNCLSMTSLFIAAARYVGLDAQFQTVAVDPTWDHDGNTMIRYEHIVATGHLAGGGLYVVDFLPEFVLGDMRTNLISDEEALALYFNNLGAEGVVEGRIDDAVLNLRHAINLRPQFSDAWNNMGAAMRRAGEYELAEFSYHRAIHQDFTNYSALSNLAQFYHYRGREKEASHFQERVNRYRSQNPYFHYFHAQLSFQQGEYSDARESLRKSIRLKREEPDFYVALAKIHEKMGEQEESLEMLAVAKKYREGTLRAPVRRMNHRFWSMMTIDVNPR